MNAELISAVRVIQAHVRRFHEQFGQMVGPLNAPRVGNGPFRARLIREECVKELCKALIAGDLPKTADGYCDGMFVLVGGAVEDGIDLGPIFAAVCETNMAKEGGGIREDGKVLKPPGWVPPDVEGLLRRQGWQP